ncbi:hypothetical protein [uncultured Ruminococcus sp.]|uniref:hypothetical protein n=1 Tax=uncultured Ruminococcus sp. TaxID=165186 RepID=UPI00266D6241|nr:hypothetical protein [uncultured Ruminococcus sp.]
MKCPNCGFDCEGNFCTMCGTSLKSQSPQTENKQNPYINIENKQPLNNSASAVQNQNNTNYVNTAQQNNYQNVQAQQQTNFSYIPQQRPNGFVNIPVQGQNGVAPIPTQSPVPKNNSGRTGKIVAACILGGVILAGMVIVIVSAIVNSLDLQLSEPTDVDKIDSTQYKVGEKAETLFGGITMTDIQTGSFSLESMTSSYDAPKEYKFDFYVENTTDDDFTISFDDFNVTVKDSSTNYSFTNISVDGNPDKLTIKPHTSDTFTIYRCDSNRKEDGSLKINYNYECGDSKGKVVFTKNCDKIYSSLFEEADTDFGTVKVTDVTKPSTKYIYDTYIKDSNLQTGGATLDESDFDDSVAYDTETFAIYEFTVNADNFSNSGKKVYLKEISASEDTAIAVVSDNYKYFISDYDSQSLNLMIDSDKTTTFKYIAAIRKGSDYYFNMSFKFDNGNTVITETSVDELEENINN